MTDAMMKPLGEANGVSWYWAEPGRFEKPGVYYWDGAQNVLCGPYPTALATQQAVQGEPARRVYLVATGELHEGEETYTRHDDAPPPLCDSECLYTTPPAPGQVERDREDAENWRYIRRKLCLTGNGDGTCSMQAINLPASIPGWPEPGQVAEFCDDAIRAARSSNSDSKGGV